MEMFQTTPLAPDVEYFMDAALEWDEIDAGTHLVCKLYGPRANLMQIVDGDRGEMSAQTRDARLARCEALAMLADEIIADLPPDRRRAISLAGLRHGRGLVQRTAWYFAVVSHEDTIRGGCLIDYKRPGNRQESARMDRYELSPKQRRRLYGRNWIKRYVRHDEDTPRLRRTCERLLRRWWPIDDFAAAMRGSDALLEELKAQRIAYRMENDRRVRAMVAESKQTPTSKIARHERRRRRVIARAASTAVSVLGRQAVSDFAHGRPVILEGQTLRLAVERSGSSAHLGHSGVGVTALDTSGNRLADMCIYYERTPALDQLTALGLAMMAGEEDEIIATANLSNVAAEAYGHPIIGAKLSTKKGDDIVVPGPAGAAQSTQRVRSSFRDIRESNETYWQETRPMWLEATGVAAMGRAWGVLEKALGPLPPGSGHGV